MNLINDIAALLAGDWQGQRLLRLDFPREDGPAARMLVNSIDAEEALSRDFAFHVEVLSDDANIPINAVMGRMVTISLVRDDGTLRYFNGYVTRFGFTKTDGGFAHYRMVLSPWLAFLRLRQDCRLFQNMDLVEICDKTFENYLQRDFQCRLIQQLPDITLAVQYNETDHNHIHRRLEDAGLFYWYEHHYDGHTLWVSDDSTYANPLDGDASTIEYRAESGSIEDDGISHWMPAQVACPMQSAVGSYNFKHASAATAEGSALFDQGSVPQHEVFESTGAYGFVDPAAGEALAQRRMDQLAVEASTVTTRGNHRALQPGRSFALAGHFFSEGDGGEHLVVSVRHIASNNYQNNDTSRSEYANEMKCVRKSAHWRPPRGHHSTDTRIYGVQTATVVGPPGEEIYTDEYGRVRVQFHWHREGKSDPTSSPWVRVMTSWAGAGFGQICLPRIGQEVVVQFLDGNCDRPLVVGSVYNVSHMPPWDLPANRSQSGILTRSTLKGESANANALRFEDKKGAEELWMHAERDQRIEVEHDESHWIGNDRKKTVDHDEIVHIKNNRTETVNNTENITIGGNRIERVKKNENVVISGYRYESVNQAKEEWVALTKLLSVGGAYAVNVGAAMNTLVAHSQFEQIGQTKACRVGQDYSVDCGNEYVLTVGASSIRMQSDGTITLKGSSVLIEGSGPVRINGKDVDIN